MFEGKKDQFFGLQLASFELENILEPGISLSFLGGKGRANVKMNLT